jgi:hypothetical protein
VLKTKAGEQLKKLLPNQQRDSGMQDKLNEQNPPIFILGVQRSGTTLLRLILNSHSYIAIPEEAEFLRPIITKKYIYNEIPEKDLKRICNYLRSSPHYALWNYDSSKFLNWLEKQSSISLKEFINNLFMSYAESEGKIRWGDKTPSLFRKLKLLHILFPEAKFIHMLRDGRDVFDSWRKMDFSKNNVAVVALEWQYKLYKIENFLKILHDDNKYTIRYEDLLISPKETLMKICNFIEMEFESQMLNFYMQSKYYVGNHHSRLIFQPINPGNLFKWKKNLTETELKVFNYLAGRYLRKYGYQVESKRMSFNDYVYVLEKLLKGLPARTFGVLKANILLKKALAGSKVMFLHGEKPKIKNS